jgi:hypothetical protein
MRIRHGYRAVKSAFAKATRYETNRRYHYDAKIGVTIAQRFDAGVFAIDDQKSERRKKLYFVPRRDLVYFLAPTTQR